MIWTLFQAAIVFGVVASNIHWQWTPNTYLASAIGFAVAYFVTMAINSLYWRWLTRRQLRADERAGQSSATLGRGEFGRIR